MGTEEGALGLWDSGPRCWAVLLFVPLKGPSLLSAPLFWKTHRLGKHLHLLLQLFLGAPHASPLLRPSCPGRCSLPGSEAQSCGAGRRLYPLSFGCGPGHRRGEVQPSSSLAGHLPAVSDQPPAALPVPPGAPSSRVVFIHQHPHPDSEKPCTPVTTCPEALVPSCPLAWPLFPLLWMPSLTLRAEPGPDHGGLSAGSGFPPPPRPRAPRTPVPPPALPHWCSGTRVGHAARAPVPPSRLPPKAGAWDWGPTVSEPLNVLLRV